MSSLREARSYEIAILFHDVVMIMTNSLDMMFKQAIKSCDVHEKNNKFRNRYVSFWEVVMPHELGFTDQRKM